MTSSFLTPQGNPLFPADHNAEDKDAGPDAIHHTLGRFKHQAAAGSHNHRDNLSVPLFEDMVVDFADLATVFEEFGATVTNKPDSDWITASLISPWVAYNTTNYGGMYYRKVIGGMVLLQGLVKSGGTGSTIAVLPSGYRPSKDLIFNQMGNSPSAAYRVDVTTEGNVTVATSPGPVTTFGWLSLSGMIFFATQ
jgi:hypothetical protein